MLLARSGAGRGSHYWEEWGKRGKNGMSGLFGRELCFEGFEGGGGFHGYAGFGFEGVGGEPGGEFFLVGGGVLGGGFVGKFEDLAAGVFPFLGGEFVRFGEFPASADDLREAADLIPWDLVEALFEKILLSEGEHSTDRMLIDGGPN